MRRPAIEIEAVTVVGEPVVELVELAPLLSEPFRHITHIPVATRRALLLLGFIGMVPLAVALVPIDYTNLGAVKALYWVLALYFSTGWAIVFSIIYHSRGARPQISAAMYFGTGLISVAILKFALGAGLDPWQTSLVGSPNIGTQIFGWIFAAGVPEELTKMLALIVLLRVIRLPPLSLFIFYGLISGLGFGFYEGIDYQSGENYINASVLADQIKHASDLQRAITEMSAYYISNLLRLTSAPFFHATWTGIAAFMLWFGARFPQRRAGFFTLALAVPALLHAFYDFFMSLYWPGTLLVALVSVAILGIYVGVADHLEERLGFVDPIAVEVAEVEIALTTDDDPQPLGQPRES